jgi:hypothetical protein
MSKLERIVRESTEERDKLLSYSARRHLLMAAELQAEPTPSTETPTDHLIRLMAVQQHLLFALCKYEDDKVRHNNLTQEA